MPVQFMHALLARTKRLIEISDEIVELNHKILDTAKAGLPENKED